MRIGLLTEGGHPHADGESGLWCDRLVRGLPQHEFDLYALSRSAHQEKPGWVSPPPRVGRVRTAPLWSAPTPPPTPFPTTDGGERRNEPGGCLTRLVTGSGDAYGRRRRRRRFVAHLTALATAVSAPGADGPTHPRDGAGGGRATGCPATALFGEGLCGLTELAREHGGLTTAPRSGTALRVREYACRARGTGRTVQRATVTDHLAFATELARLLLPLSLGWYTTESLGGVDLCHAASGRTAALPGLLAKRFFGVPLLVTEDGLPPRTRYLSAADTPFGAPARALFAPSFEETAGAGAHDLAGAYAAGGVVVLSSAVEGFPVSVEGFPVSLVEARGTAMHDPRDHLSAPGNQPYGGTLMGRAPEALDVPNGPLPAAEQPSAEQPPARAAGTAPGAPAGPEGAGPEAAAPGGADGPAALALARTAGAERPEREDAGAESEAAEVLVAGGTATAEPSLLSGPAAPAPAPVGARGAPADPVRALVRHHRELCARAVDPLEIAAGPEAHGITDRAAARYRHRDAFSPAEELCARVPRTATGPGRVPVTVPATARETPDDPDHRAAWTLHALLPGAACLATVGVLRMTEGALGTGARNALTAAGALLVFLTLRSAVATGPLRAPAGSGRTALYTCWLLGYAVYGEELLAQVLSGGPDGHWPGTPAPLLGLSLAVVPAARSAHLFAVHARRGLAGSRTPAGFGARARPVLLTSVALFLAALLPLMLLADLGYGGHGVPLSAYALGLLLFLARLETAHGLAAPAVTALAAACAVEAAAPVLVLGGRLPGLDLLARPVDVLVAAAGTGAVPALACGGAALGLLAHAAVALSRASAHHRH